MKLNLFTIICILTSQIIMNCQVYADPAALTQSNTISTGKVGPMLFNYKIQDDAFWNKHLTGDTLQVCHYHGTERAFTGKYDEFYEKGIYYCACCGGDFPLYSSETKFDSKTGWPSFYEPLVGGVVVRPDPNDSILGLFGYARDEVICARCGQHLGHVFNDGPKPTGKRYCMNSVALNFAPAGRQPKRTYEVDIAK